METVEAEDAGNAQNMGFNSLEQTNQKLFQNPELSEHNKEVLTDFFRKARSGTSGEAILQDYASRFNKLAESVDFPLDDPDQEDLESRVDGLENSIEQLDQKLDDIKELALKQRVSQRNETSIDTDTAESSKKEKIIETAKANSDLTHREIAEKVGVDRSYVSRVLKPL